MISEHASPLATLGGVDSGGQNVYVAELGQRLAALGNEVDIYTRRDADDQETVVEWAPGLRVIHVPAGPAEPVPKEDLWDYMGEFTEWFIANTEDNSYDIVHANFWMSAAVALETKRRLGIPFVVTFHAIGKVRRRSQGANDRFPSVREEIEEAVIREADQIIAECPEDEQHLIRLYNGSADAIALVPCGVNLEQFHPINRKLARRHLDIDPQSHLVLVLGRMVPRKGIETVLRALSILKERHDHDARLLIVGGETAVPDPQATPEIGKLAEVVAELGLNDRVAFAGSKPRDELRFYYSAADVFVTVPWYEPFGMTPLESMACGTPVIGSNVGGIKFTVRDGETGFLVPPRDPDALADKILALHGDPRLEQIFSVQGIRRARDIFDWDHIARMISEVYRRVIEQMAPGLRSPETETVDRAFANLVEILESARVSLSASIADAATQLADTLVNGGTVLVAGNGGSAAQAQHFAAELVGRFRRHDRRGLPVLSLCADTAIITAWANDVGYEEVFARQVEAMGKPGDMLVGMSTSGRSANVVRAFEQAKSVGIRTLAIVGGDGGTLRSISDEALVVPSRDTQRIQEVHGLLIHTLAELVEERVVQMEGTILQRVAPIKDTPPLDCFRTVSEAAARRGSTG